MRGVDHKIELVPEADLQNKAPYWLNEHELVELKKQLTEFLARGYIRPSKSPFGAPAPTTHVYWLPCAKLDNG